MNQTLTFITIAIICLIGLATYFNWEVIMLKINGKVSYAQEIVEEVIPEKIIEKKNCIAAGRACTEDDLEIEAYELGALGYELDNLGKKHGEKLEEWKEKSEKYTLIRDAYINSEEQKIQDKLNEFTSLAGLNEE